MDRGFWERPLITAMNDFLIAAIAVATALIICVVVMSGWSDKRK